MPAAIISYTAPTLLDSSEVAAVRDESEQDDHDNLVQSFAGAGPGTRALVHAFTDRGRQVTSIITVRIGRQRPSNAGRGRQLSTDRGPTVVNRLSTDR